jgi:8-oxo-dGTP diphosphatase
MQKTTAEKHLRFAVIATDVVLFTVKDKQLLVRLMRVHRPPHFANTQGMPGGLIHEEETAEEAAQRVTRERALIDPEKIYFEQLYTFSGINRDPRSRVLAVAYMGLLSWDRLSPSEQNDTEDAWWIPAREASKLAYDHNEILKVAIDRLRSRISYTTAIGKLVPKEFTLTELEQTYECILHTNLDKRNFRKKLTKLKFLTELPHKRTGGAFRPAQLYKMTSSTVHEVEVL